MNGDNNRMNEGDDFEKENVLEKNHRWGVV